MAEERVTDPPEISELILHGLDNAFVYMHNRFRKRVNRPKVAEVAGLQFEVHGIVYIGKHNGKLKITAKLGQPHRSDERAYLKQRKRKIGKPLTARQIKIFKNRGRWKTNMARMRGSISRTPEDRFRNLARRAKIVPILREVYRLHTEAHLHPDGDVPENSFAQLADDFVEIAEEREIEDEDIPVHFGRHLRQHGATRISRGAQQHPPSPVHDEEEEEVEISPPPSPRAEPVKVRVSKKVANPVEINTVVGQALAAFRNEAVINQIKKPLLTNDAAGKSYDCILIRFVKRSMEYAMGLKANIQKMIEEVNKITAGKVTYDWPKHKKIMERYHLKKQKIGYLSAWSMPIGRSQRNRQPTVRFQPTEEVRRSARARKAKNRGDMQLNS